MVGKLHSSSHRWLTRSDLKKKKEKKNLIQNKKHDHQKQQPERMRWWTLANVGTWWSRWRRWVAHHFRGQTKVVGVTTYG